MIKTSIDGFSFTVKDNGINWHLYGRQIHVKRADQYTSYCMEAGDCSAERPIRIVASGFAAINFCTSDIRVTPFESVSGFFFFKFNYL